MEKFHKICGIYPSYKIISINCNASTERNLKQSFFLHNKKNQNPLPKATHQKTLKNHLNEHPDITKKMKKDGIIIPIKKQCGSLFVALRGLWHGDPLPTRRCEESYQT